MRHLRVVVSALGSATFVAGCSLGVNGLEASFVDGGASAGRDASPGSSGGGGWSGGADASSYPNGLDATAIAVDASDAADATQGPSDPDGGNGAIDVPADHGDGCSQWFDTGFTVAQDDTITIDASGTWNYGPGPAFQCGPAGNSIGGSTQGFSYGALVGRIGSGHPFLVGDTYHGQASDGGPLQLGINDDLCGDNGGKLHVTVSIVHGS